MDLLSSWAGHGQSYGIFHFVTARLNATAFRATVTHNEYSAFTLFFLRALILTELPLRRYAHRIKKPVIRSLRVPIFFTNRTNRVWISDHTRLTCELTTWIDVIVWRIILIQHQDVELLLSLVFWPLSSQTHKSVQSFQTILGSAEIRRAISNISEITFCVREYLRRITLKMTTNALCSKNKKSRH